MARSREFGSKVQGTFAYLLFTATSAVMPVLGPPMESEPHPRQRRVPWLPYPPRGAGIEPVPLQHLEPLQLDSQPTALRWGLLNEPSKNAVKIGHHGRGRLRADTLFRHLERGQSPPVPQRCHQPLRGIGHPECPGPTSWVAV